MICFGDFFFSFEDWCQLLYLLVRAVDHSNNGGLFVYFSITIIITIIYAPNPPGNPPHWLYWNGGRHLT